MKAKKITLCGLLTALAIVLSLVERLFPLDAVVPVPGAKLENIQVLVWKMVRHVLCHEAPGDGFSIPRLKRSNGWSGAEGVAA